MMPADILRTKSSSELNPKVSFFILKFFLIKQKITSVWNKMVPTVLFCKLTSTGRDAEISSNKCSA